VKQKRKAASALNHANICHEFTDVGEENGRSFDCHGFLDGMTLEAPNRKQKHLPLELVLP